MIWLAPWALAAGSIGMLGVLTAHLLSRQRPRAVALATTRFLPSGMLEATTLQTTPTDRWWLALRLLVIALLAIGAAQPVLTGQRVSARTVLLLDRSLSDSTQRALLSALAPTDVVIAYDSTATLATPGSLPSGRAQTALLSAALGKLVRVRDSLAAQSTLLRVAVASEFGAKSIDPVTPALRALIPDSIVLVPVQRDTENAIARGPIVVHSVGDDPIAATAHLLGDRIAPAGAIVQRGAALTSADSSAAMDGATVVWWPSVILEGEPVLRAITVASSTWIASLGHDSTMSIAPAGRVIGWWADGTPAAWMRTLGRGCVLQVGAALPVAGDQTLSLAAQAWLAALVTSCDRTPSRIAPAPEWLSPAPPRAQRTLSAASRTSHLAPWLVAAALGFALLELVLRRGRKA